MTTTEQLEPPCPWSAWPTDFSTYALSGFFEPQTANAFTAASFSGSYLTGTVDPLAQSGIFDSGVLVSTGSGSVTGTQDQNAAGTLSPDGALAASYSVNPAGRVAVTCHWRRPSAIYIISPTKVLQIDLSSPDPVIQELLH
jgi:hypothetical protein